MEMILNTARMVDYDQLKEYSHGDEITLKTNLAVAFLNPEDFIEFKLTSSLNLKIANNYGKVIVKGIEKVDVPKGTILMPVSIWANKIVEISNEKIFFKNIKVTVESTTENVLSVKELLEV